MKLTLLCVGKTRERFIQDGIAKYVRYLQPYADVRIRELKEDQARTIKDAPVVRRKEAEKIRKALPPAGFVMALDERGREYSSHEFAEFLNASGERGVREMVFVVGGAMGLDESVTGDADAVLALSRWTLTHEMARVVLLEQLYRAFTIIKGKQYHY